MQDDRRVLLSRVAHPGSQTGFWFRRRYRRVAWRDLRCFDGCIVALGWLYGRANPEDDKTKVLALSGELRRAFIEKYGTTNCQQLLEQFVGQVEGQKCKKLTADTAGMLFDLVQRTNQSQS